jgi:hypothetical protein
MMADRASTPPHSTPAVLDCGEHRTIIKYNHLLANCLISHNACMKTRALHKLRAEGVLVEPDAVAALSPYVRSHISRFQQVRTVHPRPGSHACGNRLPAADLHRRHDLNGHQRNLIPARPKWVKNAGIVAIPQHGEYFKGP